MAELRGNSLKNLQAEHCGVDYYIIDEMSMVGRRVLGQIDKRLREAFPRHSEQLLGGRSMILVGDFGQLPPVGDTALWSRVEAGCVSSMAGAQAFSSFLTVVVLDTVVRQSNDTDFKEGTAASA